MSEMLDIYAAEAENRKYRDMADAARYRFLRNEAHPDSDLSSIATSVDGINSWGRPYRVFLSGEELDAAVDEAINKNG